jgi:hypothetical protein
LKKCRIVCPPRLEEAQLPLGAGIANEHARSAAEEQHAAETKRINESYLSHFVRLIRYGSLARTVGDPGGAERATGPIKQIPHYERDGA